MSAVVPFIPRSTSSRRRCDEPAEIIDFEQARRRRASLGPVDLVFITAVCFWPIGLVMFAGLIAADALWSLRSGGAP